MATELRTLLKSALKILFLFLNQIICCGYSKEPSQWDSSFKHPQHMIKLMGKKIFTILRSKMCLSKPMWATATTFGLLTCTFLLKQLETNNSPVITVKECLSVIVIDILWINTIEQNIALKHNFKLTRLSGPMHIISFLLILSRSFASNLKCIRRFT